MNEVTISKNRLIVVYAVIVVLVILVIILYLGTPPTQPPIYGELLEHLKKDTVRNLGTPPTQPPIYGEFLEHLKKDTVRSVTLISDQGELTVFDKNLSLLSPCGKTQDKNVPARCREGVRPSNFNQLNAVTITVFGASPESTVLIRTDDPTWYILPPPLPPTLPPPLCPDGLLPPC